MSDKARATHDAPQTRTGGPFERRLFHYSPLGMLGTALVLFVILFGSFLGLTYFEGATPIRLAGYGINFDSGAWPAFVLSLLCSVVLGFQRYARLKEIEDGPAFAAILEGGAASAARLTGFMQRDARLGIATTVGVFLGIAASAIILSTESGSGAYRLQPGIMGWFFVVIMFLMVMFARGVEMTRKGTASFERLMDDELKIDLLHIDKLSVLGRSGARGSLVWFTVTATTCLFFAGGEPLWYILFLLVSCTMMGLRLFLGVMAHVHRRIRSTKEAELDRIRDEILVARSTMADDVVAAQKLPGLLAYEARIAAVREWPFDQTTAMRLAAYVFIPAVPWFGQALAQYLVEAFARHSG